MAGKTDWKTIEQVGAGCQQIGCAIMMIPVAIIGIIIAYVLVSAAMHP